MGESIRWRVRCRELERLRSALLAALFVALGLTGCSRSPAPVPPRRTPVPPIHPSTHPPPVPRFVDVASAAGLKYRWQIPGSRPLNILQTIGNGCAFLDYNNDGNLDILLVGPRLALYRGDGHGTFTDVSGAVGLDRASGHFLGCAVGDVDGDGFDDLYVSGYRTGLLFKNEAGRRFRDITREAGLKAQPWGTSCAFLETVPGSGRLDLYVANYAVFGPDQPQLCKEHALFTSCGPRYYHPLKGILYRNDGRGHFADLTRASGAGEVTGRGLGVAVADFDGSGRPGIAIENDELAGDLLRPAKATRSGAYTNTGELSGTAFDRDGNVHGGMGADWGDYDNDGKLDLFVGTFQHESKCLYHNDGDGSFSEVGNPSGIGSPAAPNVTFGCKWFDYDNDGWLDLMIANGHVQDNIHQIDPGATYRQPTELFHNKGGQPPSFEDVSTRSGPALMQPIVGRGLAVGDYDNDGRLDVLVVDSEGKPLLLHNTGGPAGHWLGIRLAGSTCNRNGYGAVLTARIGTRTLVRQCTAAGSYLSSSDPRVHFGLGSATQVDSLVVRWPGGQQQELKNLPADRYMTIREGSQN